MVRLYVVLIIFFLSIFHTNGQTIDTNYNIVTFIEKEPYFKGDLIDFIQKRINYPSHAIKDSIEGTVYISFWIDTLGYTSEHTILQGIREDINNEALRVSELIKFDKPGIQKGKPIRVQYFIPVKFVLPEKKVIKKEQGRISSPFNNQNY